MEESEAVMIRLLISLVILGMALSVSLVVRIVIAEMRKGRKGIKRNVRARF